MFRKYRTPHGIMQASCSTFTPPTSIFRGGIADDVLHEWVAGMSEGKEAECTAILHAKSTLGMSPWNCNCKRVTCIKIRPPSGQPMPSSARHSCAITSPLPPTLPNRKYLARLKPKPTTPTPAPPMPMPNVVLRRNGTGEGRRQNRHAASYSMYLTDRPRLPSYGRVADSLDHILRICSRLRQLLSAPSDTKASEEFREEMITKSQALVMVMRRSAYEFYLLQKGATDCCGLVDCLDNLAQVRALDDLPQVTQGFLDLVRKLVEETVHLNCWVIISYLEECDDADCLLPVALEHLIHLLLFESEPCLEVIQSNTIQHLIALSERPSTPDATLQLLLRALSVLCGVRAACVQLLSIGGYTLIIDFVLHASPAAAIEASGVLSQLTRPNYSLVEIGKHADAVIGRLLHLAETACQSAESMLLCVSVLANVAYVQNSNESETEVSCLFEARDVVHRLLAVLTHHPGARGAHVDAQIIDIMLNFAGSITSDLAVPFLCSVLENVEDAKYQKLHPKASLCLRMLWNTDRAKDDEELFRPIKVRSSSSGSSSLGFQSSPTSGV